MSLSNITMAQRAQLDRRSSCSVVNRYADYLDYAHPNFNIGQVSHTGTAWPHAPTINQDNPRGGCIRNMDAGLRIPMKSVQNEPSVNGLSMVNYTKPGSSMTYSVVLPSATGGTYLTNYDDGEGTYSGDLARWNYIIAKARRGQTWTVRVWLYNIHSGDDIEVRMWIFGVDSHCNYSHTGYTDVDAADSAQGGTPATGGSFYFSDLVIPGNNTWTVHDMTITFGAFDWIQGITTRLDNHSQNEGYRWIYANSWGLWRRNISMKNDIMGSPGPSGNGIDYDNISLGGHSYGLIQTIRASILCDNDNEDDLKFAFFPGDSFCVPGGSTADDTWTDSSDGTLSTISSAAKGCTGDRNHFKMHGFNGSANGGTADQTPVNSAWPPYGTIYGGYLNFSIGSSHAICVRGDVGHTSTTAVTYAFWINIKSGNMTTHDKGNAMWIFDATMADGNGTSMAESEHYGICMYRHNSYDGHAKIIQMGNRFCAGGSCFRQVGYDFPDDTHLGKWIHCMFTSTGAGVASGGNLYINGVHKATGTGFGTKVEENFLLGGYYNRTDLYSFDGHLKDVCIYSVVLGETEAQDFFLDGRAAINDGAIYDAGQDDWLPADWDFTWG